MITYKCIFDNNIVTVGSGYVFLYQVAKRGNMVASTIDSDSGYVKQFTPSRSWPVREWD